MADFANMDAFEKAGIDLHPQVKTNLVRALHDLNMSIEQCILLLRQWHQNNDLTAMNLSGIGLRLDQLRIRDLPKTSSKGYWRDVMPRRR